MHNTKLFTRVNDRKVLFKEGKAFLQYVITTTSENLYTSDFCEFDEAVDELSRIIFKSSRCAFSKSLIVNGLISLPEILHLSYTQSD